MTTPPPYTNITGISTVIAKDSNVSLNEFDGNARPGQLVIDLETNPPSLYIGSADGTLSSLGAGGNANTGNITFSGVQIIGSGDGSGDGNGFSTIELVPDEDLYGTDQYLVIDPTFPTHIHIRAGGTQDASNAELFLGGERTHVRVTDEQMGEGVFPGSVRILTTEFIQDSLTVTGITNASWYESEGLYYIDFTSNDPDVPSYINNLFNGRGSIGVSYNSDTASATLTPNFDLSIGNQYSIEVSDHLLLLIVYSFLHLSKLMRPSRQQVIVLTFRHLEDFLHFLMTY